MVKKAKAPEIVADEEEGRANVTWPAKALTKAESKRLYPYRVLDSVVPAGYRPSKNLQHIAKAHYGKAQNEDLTVKLGDFVKVWGPDENYFLMRVNELFEDVTGNKMFHGHFLYLPEETDMAFLNNQSKEREIEVPQDPQRVFLATTTDSETYTTVHEIGTIDTVVRIKWVKPGTKPLTKLPEGEYWFDQCHSRVNMTFRDLLDAPDWSSDHFSPIALVREAVELAATAPDAPAAADSGAAGSKASPVPAGAAEPAWYDSIGMSWHFGPNAVERAKKMGQTVMSNVMIIKALELCCGVGGLSFICQEGVINGQHVKIVCMWAVDFNEDAIATYSINHPHTHCYCMGMDEFLMMCKIFESELCESFPENRKRKAPGALSKRKYQLVDMRLRESAKRGTSGQGEDQLLSELKREECWLEFLPMTMDADGAWVRGEWTAHADLPASSKEAVGDLVDEWRRNHKLPMMSKREVNVIAGGPPCQGMSGLNRYKDTSNILEHAKNRLIMTYFDYVKYFTPNWVLTEQVIDILKNENGRYGSYALASLAALRYQCRAGIIAAGEHGVPQGRYRVLIWGASQGNMLPSFPEPSHEVLVFNRTLMDRQKPCRVNRLSNDPKRKALCMVLLGDVLSDLPEVHNYRMTDTAVYKCEPQNPFQRWMRRAAPPGCRTLTARAEGAEMLMGPALASYRNMVKETFAKQGMIGVGTLMLCKKDTSSISNYAYETHLAMVREQTEGRGYKAAQKAEVAMQLDNEREGYKAAFCEELGRTVMRQVLLGEQEEAKAKAAAKAGGKANVPLRDHRPLMCNADDWQRMAGVPHGKDNNYRQMAGMVSENVNGTSCAGHCHLRAKDDTDMGACRGGGTMERRKNKGNCKNNRAEVYDKNGWRGTSLPGCKATTHFLPSADLLVPRWCMTYKVGLSRSRHGCFGRCHPTEVQPTVVGRAEPHNLALVHPKENRVLSMRENARCQGFPDHWVLSSVGGQPQSRGVSGGVIATRYQQMGNAVAPPVASALGRCLLVAAAATVAWTTDRPVIPVPDHDMLQSYAESKRRREQMYAVVHSIVPEDGRKGPGKKKARVAEVVAGQAEDVEMESEAQSEDSDDDDDDDDEEDADKGE